MSELSHLQTLVANALECVDIKLVRTPEDVDNDEITFHPHYAHQIFGENEVIFGYKDLKVRLYYTAGSLNIYLGTKYSFRIDDFDKDGLKADEVESKIAEIITAGVYYTNIDEFLTKLKKESSFVPIGDKVDSIQKEENGKIKTFEFYKCDINTPNFSTYHDRLQTFLLWFVDAGSYIDIDDPQWLFFVCYEKYTTSEGNVLYATCGYSTIYLYYAYPDNIRPRISQMLVLPPFQKLGIGTKFIEVIYNHFKDDSKVVDITVEDPSDDFKRIRNYVDVKLCQDLPSFTPEKLRQGFSREMVKETKEAFKINPRQCRVIYEILRLRNTNVNNEAEYRAYRLDVKKRLNLNYHKQLQDIRKMEKAGRDTQWIHAGLATIPERIEQLKDEFKELEEDYQRILKRINF